MKKVHLLTAMTACSLMISACEGPEISLKDASEIVSQEYINKERISSIGDPYLVTENGKYYVTATGDLETIANSFPGGHALFANGYQYNGEPIMVTEFGGISFCKDGTEGWGYTAASDQEDFLTRYRNVVEPLLDSPYVQGFVYTQLTDVEQEINGLMTYDREFKVPPEEIRKINR